MIDERSCCQGILQCNTTVRTLCVEGGWGTKTHVLCERVRCWQRCGGACEGFLPGDLPGPWPAWLHVCCWEAVKPRRVSWLLRGLLWALRWQGRPVPPPLTSCLEAPRVAGYLLLQICICFVILKFSERWTWSFEQLWFETFGRFVAIWDFKLCWVLHPVLSWGVWWCHPLQKPLGPWEVMGCSRWCVLDCAIVNFVMSAERDRGPSVAQVLETLLAATPAQLRTGMESLNLELSVWHFP